MDLLRIVHLQKEHFMILMITKIIFTIMGFLSLITQRLLSQIGAIFTPSELFSMSNLKFKMYGVFSHCSYKNNIFLSLYEDQMAVPMPPTSRSRSPSDEWHLRLEKRAPVGNRTVREEFGWNISLKGLIGRQSGFN